MSAVISVASPDAKTLRAAPFAGRRPTNCECIFPVQQYDLEATLTSGQTFGWERSGAGWTSVVQGRWVRLYQDGDSICAQTAEPQLAWDWLVEYLQVEVNLSEVLATFPADPHLRAATA